MVSKIQWITAGLGLVFMSGMAYLALREEKEEYNEKGSSSFDSDTYLESDSNGNVVYHKRKGNRHRNRNDEYDFDDDVSSSNVIGATAAGVILSDEIANAGDNVSTETPNGRSSIKENYDSPFLDTPLSTTSTSDKTGEDTNSSSSSDSSYSSSSSSYGSDSSSSSSDSSSGGGCGGGCGGGGCGS